MNICVVGTGYVGLVAGTCFAESGNDVVCVDKDAAKIAGLTKGSIPIYEPGLAELVSRNFAEGRLSFTTDLAEAVRKCEVIFIAVGTPDGPDGPDLSSVVDVAQRIASAMDGHRIIVNKSTVPVGTADHLRTLIGSLTDAPFDVVSNPEFLKEGAALDDFLKPDRVVIGTSDERAAEVMKELYSPFVRTGKPVMVMDARSAEMTKYASNAMLASRMSFMNEIATLCEKLGADVELVRQGVGADSRIGNSFLFAGVGYGGSCFPKDVLALIKMGRANEAPARMMQAIHDVNEAQKRLLAAKVIDYFGPKIAGVRIAMWGLSFKPGTDDMRESPSIVIIEELLAAGAQVTAYDPVAQGAARDILKDRITYGVTNYDALKQADALLVVTEWSEFRHPDFNRMKTLMRQPIIFDGRNLYSPAKMAQLGIDYFCIGRPHMRPPKP